MIAPNKPIPIGLLMAAENARNMLQDLYDLRLARRHKWHRLTVHRMIANMRLMYGRGITVESAQEVLDQI